MHRRSTPQSRFHPETHWVNGYTRNGIPLQLYSTYASTEMQSSFTECNEFHGGHLQPELIIVEFLDDNNQPVKEGGSRRSDHHDFGSKRNAAAPFQDPEISVTIIPNLAPVDVTLSVSAPYWGAKDK